MKNTLIILNAALTTISSVLADPLPTEAIKEGLILHYNFDREPIGGTITDLSGNGNDGHAVGVRWTSEGHSNGAIIFGPTNSYITVTNNQALNPPQFTLSVWIKASYKDKFWRRIFDKGFGHGYDLTMGGDDNGKSWEGQMFFEVVTAAAGTRMQVTDGKWHHVAGTFDAAQLQIYVDGRRVGMVPAKGKPVPTMYDLTIGQNRSNANQATENGQASFFGVMDDVMMFNRALSADEVQALFTSQGGLPVQGAANASCI